MSIVLAKTVEERYIKQATKFKERSEDQHSFLIISAQVILRNRDCHIISHMIGIAQG
jgi:hypothetical protein